MGIRERFRQLIDRLFVAEDAVARARGWEISRSPNGLGRVYRDPRWDLILECKVCRGGADSGGESCPLCAGRGTVRRSQADISCGGAT